MNLTLIINFTDVSTPQQFYMKTGKCKFGLTCKFNHPKDIQLPSSSQDNGSTEAVTSDPDAINNPHVTFAPAAYHNSKGLPVRPVMISASSFIRIDIFIL